MSIYVYIFFMYFNPTIFLSIDLYLYPDKPPAWCMISSYWDGLSAIIRNSNSRLWNVVSGSRRPTVPLLLYVTPRKSVERLRRWSPGRLFKSQPRPLVVPWMCVHWTQKHPPWFLGGCWWGWDFTESINNTSIAKAIGHIIHIDSKNACTGFSPNHEMSHQNNELCIYK